MYGLLKKIWILWIVRGALALLFGLALLLFPKVGIGTFILLLGLFLFFDGVIVFFSGLTTYRREAHRLKSLVTGAATAALGMIAIVAPIASAVVLMVLVGVCLIAGGLTDVAAASRYRKSLPEIRLIYVPGLLLAALGLIVILNPWYGALGFAYLIGVGSVIRGLLTVFFGFGVKRLIDFDDT